MTMLSELRYCPGSLTEYRGGYSPNVLRRLFDGHKVSPILPYNSPQEGSNLDLFIENRRKLSISGVQEKLSLKLTGNRLELTSAGQRGDYILKPIPRDLKLVDDVPGNEHLTMQIAQQIYGLKTAENTLIFFADGQPAYLTRRFDIKSASEKFRQEDFAALAGKTKATDGISFKYCGSYAIIAGLIKKYVPAHRVEIENLYRLVIFNYLFSNGDAHLKNFSLIETIDHDFILSPAYDLICTRLHVEDGYFALDDGLYDGAIETASFQALGFYAYDDFYQFGIKLNIPEQRVQKILKTFTNTYEAISIIIGRAYISKQSRNLYLEYYQDRLRALRTSFSKLI